MTSAGCPPSIVRPAVRRILMLVVIVASLFLESPRSGAQSRTDATMTFRVGDVLAFSIISNEQLSIGSFKVTYDYVDGKEFISLAGTVDTDIGDASLEYADGQLVSATIRMGEEPGLMIDARTRPPVVRWEVPDQRALPDPAEVARRTQMLERTGAALRAAFGLGQFHGRKDEEVRLALSDREIVSVEFSPPQIWRAVYLFIDPANESMVEVLRHEDFAEWTNINVSTRRFAIEQQVERGLLNRRIVLVWEDGRWRAEEDEYRVDRTMARSRVIPVGEASAILADAVAMVTRTRRQFQTETFTVGLERFGSP